jgi:hypothetical protein
MKKQAYKKRIFFVLAALLAVLLLVETAQAMSSTNYGLNWFTPFGSSAGASQSVHYQGRFTLGQSVVGAAASAHFQVRLGYWSADPLRARIFLPLALRQP